MDPHPPQVKPRKKYREMLGGGDLRSIGKADALAASVSEQAQFDTLFAMLRDEDRKVAMRAADAVEKVTRTQPAFLTAHHAALVDLLLKGGNKELKWHLALLASRVKLSRHELDTVWDKLSAWATSNSESRIVRVNALQALAELAGRHPERADDFRLTASAVQKENIPSINARLRKLAYTMKG